MAIITDMSAGKAGEYLVCADIILQGHIAFPSEQGLPFDVVADYGGRLLRIQVKTTRGPRAIPQRSSHIPGYLFNLKRCGKGGKLLYAPGQVDIFALVVLDSREIGYLPSVEVKRTMVFRCPDSSPNKTEITQEVKDQILDLRRSGESYPRIAKMLSLHEGTIGQVVRRPELYPFEHGRTLCQFTLDNSVNCITEK